MSQDWNQLFGLVVLVGVVGVIFQASRQAFASKRGDGRFAGQPSKHASPMQEHWHRFPFFTAYEGSGIGTLYVGGIPGREGGVWDPQGDLIFQFSTGFNRVISLDLLTQSAPELCLLTLSKASDSSARTTHLYSSLEWANYNALLANQSTFTRIQASVQPISKAEAARLIGSGEMLLDPLLAMGGMGTIAVRRVSARESQISAHEVELRELKAFLKMPEALFQEHVNLGHFKRASEGRLDLDSVVKYRRAMLAEAVRFCGPEALESGIESGMGQFAKGEAMECLARIHGLNDRRKIQEVIARESDLTRALVAVFMSFGLHQLPPAVLGIPAVKLAQIRGEVTTADLRTHLVAGCGKQQFVDGGALEAGFAYPGGLAFDRQGALLIADFQNHRIRMLDRDGHVTTLAGSGIGCQDGDVASARFDSPAGIAVSPNGDIAVADWNNDRIRLIRDGQVTTVAKNLKKLRPVGVAFSPDGTLYYADQVNNRICAVDPEGVGRTICGKSGVTGLVDGSSEQARFDCPEGIDFDAEGNLYVADHQNHAIRRVSPRGHVITLAGGGEAGLRDGQGAAARFMHPSDVVVDREARFIYVADYGNNAIRRISFNGEVETIAGAFAGYVEGPAGEARFSGPYALALGPDGALYVADSRNHRIRKLTGLA